MRELRGEWQQEDNKQNLKRNLKEDKLERNHVIATSARAILPILLVTQEQRVCKWCAKCVQRVCKGCAPTERSRRAGEQVQRKIPHAQWRVDNGHNTRANSSHFSPCKAHRVAASALTCSSTYIRVYHMDSDADPCAQLLLRTNIFFNLQFTWAIHLFG